MTNSYGSVNNGNEPVIGDRREQLKQHLGTAKNDLIYLAKKYIPRF